MAIDLATIMDEIGVALKTIPKLRVFDFPPASAQPPFAFVNLPETVDYDLTFGRGFDRMTLQVFLGVSAAVDRAARDLLVAYVSGAGPMSIKAAIEAGAVGSTTRVTRAEFATIALASGVYAGASFDIDVAA